MEQATLQFYLMEKRGFAKSSGRECLCFILIFLQIEEERDRGIERGGNGDGEKEGRAMQGDAH